MSSRSSAILLCIVGLSLPVLLYGEEAPEFTVQLG